jgi:hypothetical protein
MDLSAHAWAAAAIVLMVGITAFMDWVPTPLNRNIHGMSVRERLPSTIIHSTLGLGFAIANGLAWKWAILAGALWFSVVLVAAVRNWWIAYFFGVHQGEITPEIYGQHYAHNVTVLPRFKQNPVIPDVQHTLIHVTVVAAVLLSWYSFWVA